MALTLAIWLMGLRLAWQGPTWRDAGLLPYVRQPLPIALRNRPLRRPPIVAWMLPYQEWRQEYRDYFQRHCHQPTHVLRPTMIVMHYTVTHNAQSVWDSFVRGTRMDGGDYGFLFGHPSVHFMIDHDGTVFQLLPTHWRCTGAYGVNHCALSIEMVALTEDELLLRPAQIYASFCLVQQLMEEFSIPLDRVIGHFDVSCGKRVVPDYLDFADSKWPSCYPPAAFRFDPGITYMGWLKRRLDPPRRKSRADLENRRR